MLAAAARLAKQEAVVGPAAGRVVLRESHLCAQVCSARLHVWAGSPEHRVMADGFRERRVVKDRAKAILHAQRARTPFPGGGRSTSIYMEHMCLRSASASPLSDRPSSGSPAAGKHGQAQLAGTDPVQILGPPTAGPDSGPANRTEPAQRAFTTDLIVHVTSLARHCIVAKKEEAHPIKPFTLNPSALPLSRCASQPSSLPGAGLRQVLSVHDAEAVQLPLTCVKFSAFTMQKPSSWYSSAQWRRLSMTSGCTAGWPVASTAVPPGMVLHATRQTTALWVASRCAGKVCHSSVRGEQVRRVVAGKAAPPDVIAAQTRLADPC